MNNYWHVANYINILFYKYQGLSSLLVVVASLTKDMQTKHELIRINKIKQMPKNDFTVPKAHTFASNLLLCILLLRFKRMFLLFSLAGSSTLDDRMAVLRSPDQLILLITLVITDGLLPLSFALSLD